MKRKLDKGQFVRALAKEGGFNISDTYIFLNTMISIFEDCVVDDVGLDIYGFGKLYVQTLPPRKGSKLVSGGKELPEAKRVIFKLSDNIRRLAK